MAAVTLDLSPVGILTEEAFFALCHYLATAFLLTH